MYDGKLYSSGAGGVIYCYDLADGEVLWERAIEDPYQEYLFANNWWQFFLWIVDENSIQLTWNTLLSNLCHAVPHSYALMHKLVISSGKLKVCSVQPVGEDVQ
jgi:outer membrane protein assembly factor BamB